jgi:hypothetical protein
MGTIFAKTVPVRKNVLTKNCSKGMWVMDYRIVSDYGTSVPKVYGCWNTQLFRSMEQAE